MKNSPSSSDIWRNILGGFLRDLEEKHILAGVHDTSPPPPPPPLHMTWKPAPVLLDLHASRGPPSGCRWGPAGCPAQSGASTRGTGPAPRTAPSGWCTAGRSRSALSRRRWSWSRGRPRTRSPRSGRLYLFGEKETWKWRGGVRIKVQVLFMLQVKWTESPPAGLRLQI